MKYILTIFLFSSHLFASPFSMEDGELRNMRDSRTGLILDDYSTKDDSARFNFNVFSRPDLRKSGELLGIEVQYAKRFDYAWLEVSASQTKADTLSISDKEQFDNHQDLIESQSTLTVISAGLSHRSRYIQNLFSSNWYEVISAHLTYNMMNEPTQDLNYTGIGLKTELSLQRRLSPSYYWGVKGSYAISSVRREAETESESPSERTILLDWMSIGLELGFYF